MSKKSISMETLEHAASVLRVIAHPHRLKLVELLSQRSLAVGELAEALGIAANACSQHLNIMRAHGVVQGVRDGKSIYYEVVDPHALTLIDCIRKHGGQ